MTINQINQQLIHNHWISALTLRLTIETHRLMAAYWIQFDALKEMNS